MDSVSSPPGVIESMVRQGIVTTISEANLDSFVTGEGLRRDYGVDPDSLDD